MALDVPTTEYRTDLFSMTFGQEGGFGVAATTPNHFGLFDTAQLPDPSLRWKYFYGVGTDRNRGTALRGPWSFRGSIPDILLQGTQCGNVLALVLGRLDADGAVREGVNATDGRVPSFTMTAAARNTGGEYTFIRQWKGGKVSRATIACREGEELRLGLDELIFQDISHNIAFNTGNPNAKQPLFITPGAISEPTISAQSRYMFAGASISFGGVGICAIRDFSLSIDNQLRERYYLCRDAGDPDQLSQVPTDIQEGKRTYKLAVGIDLLSHQTDLILFEYLVNQATFKGADATATPTTGFELTADFKETPGEGNGSLQIQCGFNPTASHVGTVVESGALNPNTPPDVLFSGDYSLDTNTVIIFLPTS